MNTVSHTLNSHSWRVDTGGRDDTLRVFQTFESRLNFTHASHIWSGYAKKSVGRQAHQTNLSLCVQHLFTTKLKQSIKIKNCNG